MTISVTNWGIEYNEIISHTKVIYELPRISLTEQENRDYWGASPVGMAKLQSNATFTSYLRFIPQTVEVFYNAQPLASAYYNINSVSSKVTILAPFNEKYAFLYIRYVPEDEQFYFRDNVDKIESNYPIKAQHLYNDNQVSAIITRIRNSINLLEEELELQPTRWLGGTRNTSFGRDNIFVGQTPVFFVHMENIKVSLNTLIVHTTDLYGVSPTSIIEKIFTSESILLEDDVYSIQNKINLVEQLILDNS